MSIQPLFVLFLGVLLLGERIRLMHVVACVVGAAGVGLLVLRSDASLTFVGVPSGMAGALSMAAGNVLTKRWGRPDDVGLLGFTGLQLAMGGVMLLPVTLAVDGLPGVVTLPNLGGFAYLSVIGALAAYAVWFRGIQRLPTMVVSFLGFLSPLVATVLGLMFLGEALSGWRIVGAVLVLRAVGLVQGRARTVTFAVESRSSVITGLEASLYSTEVPPTRSFRYDHSVVGALPRRVYPILGLCSRPGAGSP